MKNFTDTNTIKFFGKKNKLHRKGSVGLLTDAAKLPPKPASKGLVTNVTANVFGEKKSY